MIMIIACIYTSKYIKKILREDEMEDMTFIPLTFKEKSYFKEKP